MTFIAVILFLIGMAQLASRLGGGGGGSGFSAGTAMRVGRLGGLLGKMLRR